MLILFVAMGMNLSKGCTNWSFQHHRLESELLIDSGRLIFAQPDGSLTAINLADGRVLARQPLDTSLTKFALGEDAGFHERLMHNSWMYELSVQDRRIVCGRGDSAMLLDRGTLEPRGIERGWKSALTRDQIMDYRVFVAPAYDGPQRPERKWELEEPERAALGLPPADDKDTDVSKCYNVFPGGFLFSIENVRTMNDDSHQCPVSYRDRDNAWSGDVSYVSRHWFNQPDRILITDDVIIIAATYGQIECLERGTGRSRWLYVYPTRRYLLSKQVWDGGSWEGFYTSRLRAYNAGLADKGQTGTILDGASVGQTFSVIGDPSPANLYLKTTLFAYVYAFLPALLLLFLLILLLCARRRGAREDDAILGVRVGVLPQPATLAANCAFLSFGINVFGFFAFHVSFAATALMLSLGVAAWIVGLIFLATPPTGNQGAGSKVLACVMLLLTALPVLFFDLPSLLRLAIARGVF